MFSKASKQIHERFNDPITYNRQKDHEHMRWFYSITANVWTPTNNRKKKMYYYNPWQFTQQNDLKYINACVSWCLNYVYNRTDQGRTMPEL